MLFQSFLTQHENDFISSDHSIGTSDHHTLYFWGEVFNLDELKQLSSDQKLTTNVTDLLLNLYHQFKEKFISYLNGHFAIIIIDESMGEILLFNDRFNTIPCFYYYNKQSNHLIIADDIRKIANCANVETSINYNYLFTLNKATIKNPSIGTYANDIFMLRGGCYLKVTSKTAEIAINYYWNIDNFYLNNQYESTYIKSQKKDLITIYKNLLKRAVKIRSLDTNETSLLLSGGFDSSSIGAFIDCSPASIYTACTFNSILNNELERANEISQKLNVEHHVIPFFLKNKLSPNDWYNTVLESQSVDCNLDFFIKNQTIKNIKQNFPNAKYVLSGYGSDQLIGGLTAYDNAGPRNSRSWANFYQSQIEYENTEMLTEEANAFYHFSYHFFNKEHISDLRVNKHNEHWLNYITRKIDLQTHSSSQLESQLSLKNDVLFRYPFFDNNLVDFILAIPKKHHEDLFYNKTILREAMKDKLPISFQDAPKFKHGFANKNLIIYNFLKPIIYGNNYELLRKIFNESPEFNKVFNKKLLLNFLEFNKNSKYFPSYSFIIRIINIGLLDIGLKNKSKNTWHYNVKPIIIDKIEKDILRLKKMMQTNKFNLDNSKPLIKLKEYEVLKSTTENKYYLKVQEKFLTIKQENILFLAQIDQKKSIDDILKITGLNINLIEKNIKELIAMEIIGFLKG